QLAVRSTPASLAGWEVGAIYHAHSTVQNVATRRGTAPSTAPAFRATQPDPGRRRGALFAYGPERYCCAVWGHSRSPGTQSHRPVAPTVSRALVRDGHARS